MSPDPRQRLGRIGERLAAEHLERLGYDVVERNARTRFGEIDLIATDACALVFCEVKTRRASNGRSPWESLHQAKRTQVRRMARAWLADHDERPRRAELRFDAIGITIDARGALVALDHLEGAF